MTAINHRRQTKKRQPPVNLPPRLSHAALGTLGLARGRLSSGTATRTKAYGGGARRPGPPRALVPTCTPHILWHTCAT